MIIFSYIQLLSISMLCNFPEPAISAIASAGGKHGRHAATPRPLCGLFGVYMVCNSPLSLQAQCTQSPAALQPQHTHKFHPQSLKWRVLSMVSWADLNFAWGGRTGDHDSNHLHTTCLSIWWRMSSFIYISLIDIGVSLDFPWSVSSWASKNSCPGLDSRGTCASLGYYVTQRGCSGYWYL